MKLFQQTITGFDGLSPRDSMLRRGRLFARALLIVLVLSALKALVHALGLEFLSLTQLFATTIGGAIFILGFLLRGLLSDYKEAERLPGELRVALEAIHDDIVHFTGTGGWQCDATVVRGSLMAIAGHLRTGVKTDCLRQQMPLAEREVDRLSALFAELEGKGMPANYIVRLRGSQDQIRRTLFRIDHIQRIQVLPSAHILAQSLVTMVIALMLVLKTPGSPESALMFAVIGYLLVFVLLLIDALEKPFGDTEKSFDDVSLFHLREFEAKLGRLNAQGSQAERGTL
jgi:hypothetical protein